MEMVAQGLFPLRPVTDLPLPGKHQQERGGAGWAAECVPAAPECSCVLTGAGSAAKAGQGQSLAHPCTRLPGDSVQAGMLLLPEGLSLLPRQALCHKQCCHRSQEPVPMS